MERIPLTIKRSEWLRGGPSESSRLLVWESHLMCCLGFCAIASGYDRDDIADVPGPASLIADGEPMGFMDRLIKFQRHADGHGHAIDTNTSRALMVTNDDSQMGDIERECFLSWFFAEIDVDVEFVD